MASIYDIPEAYLPILEKTEDVLNAEVSTLLKLLARRRIASGKLLEIGCRVAEHGLRLSEAGFEVVALDPSQSMLDEARRQADKRGLAIKTELAEPVDFELEETDFSAAIFMYENFPQIIRLPEIFEHFEAVHACLRPGGVFIVDVDSLTHGIRRRGGVRSRRTIVLERGYAERWFEDMPGDWVYGTNCEVLNCRIMLDGKLHETCDTWCYRMYTPWDLTLLASAMDGWRMEGAYSWRDPEADIAKEEHYFAEFVRL
jgi:SAM-dependent methyltransferase